jgi:uncharacterized protein YyaL (SSP411 family)
MIKPNRLIDAKSQYLLQHAYNPVDWYPWCSDAFIKAVEYNKPIFLSIGYSSCHWCHVMEHESFSDEIIAGLLNDAFVCIKVDREERPDIDAAYMEVCQAITGGGGWPLTIIMTPEKLPFFAATYIPSHSRGTLIGLYDLVPEVKRVWSHKHSEIVQSSQKLVQSLKDFQSKETRSHIPSESVVHRAFEQLHKIYDTEAKGFGMEPKFPSPHNYIFLLHYWFTYKNKDALKMVEESLQAMRNGGLFDQLGFGFFRYSTDRYWKVPHFEKMLYDQATLLYAYSEAYAATKNEIYRRTCNEILEFITTSLISDNNAYYASIDADTDGHEGETYLWTKEELVEILGNEPGLWAADNFGISAENENSQIENKIMYNVNEKNGSELMIESPVDYEEKKDTIRKILLNHRRFRPQPTVDKKIVTDWNGLMIAALARSARNLMDSRYENAAVNAAESLLESMVYNSDQLLHTSTDPMLQGFLDDYSFFVWGLLELYLTTYNTDWLDYAVRYNSVVLRDFYDDKSGALHFTSSYHESLITRSVAIHDNAYPSGVSVTLQNQFLLYLITGNVHYEKCALQIVSTIGQNVSESAGYCTNTLAQAHFWLRGAQRVVIAGDPDLQDTKEMVYSLQKAYIPDTVVILKHGTKNEHLQWWNEYTENGAGPMVYICDNEKCLHPLMNNVDMMNVVNRKNTP